MRETERDEPHLVPLPRGMSDGFYAFMGAGCKRGDDGTVLMLNPRVKRCRCGGFIFTTRESGIACTGCERPEVSNA